MSIGIDLTKKTAQAMVETGPSCKGSQTALWRSVLHSIASFSRLDVWKSESDSCPYLCDFFWTTEGLALSCQAKYVAQQLEASLKVTAQ